MSPLSNQDRFVSIILGLVTLLLALGSGFLFLQDYSREDDYLFYQLAQNLHEGHGLVYNANDKTLLVTSPLLILPLAIQPDAAADIAVMLYAIGIGGISSSIFRLSRRQNLSYLTIGTVIGVWLLASPLWWGLRSGTMVAGFMILSALENEQRPLLSGILTGIAILIQPIAIIPALLLGIYLLPQKGLSRYWLTVCIPATVWGIYAAFFYENIDLWIPQPPTHDTTLQAILWLGLFILSIILLTRLNTPRWGWFLAVWAGIETIAVLLITDTLPIIESIPLTLTVALGLALYGTQRNLAQQSIFTTVSITAMAVLLIVTFPQPQKSIQEELRLGESLSISAQSSIAHTYTDVLPYGIEDYRGNAYRLDGEHSPWIINFIARQDYQSLIVSLSPDYLYAGNQDLPFDLESQNIKPLGYTPVPTTDGLWQRQNGTGNWEETQSVGVAYGLDLRLVGYAIDRSVLYPDQTLRVRLDWELNLYPTTDVGVFINLIPPNGIPVASIFPNFPAANWQADTLSTYHALVIPAEAITSIVDLNVVINYEAGILGNHNIGRLILLPQVDASFLANPSIGQLGGVELRYAQVYQENDGLRVQLVWNPIQSLARDYRTFIHFTPINNVVPLTQADGPPIGGQYPTSTWLPNHPIQDTFFVPLYDYSSGTAQPLVAGDYVMRVGFYDPDNGQRLTNDQGDSLMFTRVTINPDGSVIIQPR